MGGQYAIIITYWWIIVNNSMFWHVLDKLSPPWIILDTHGVTIEQPPLGEDNPLMEGTSHGLGGEEWWDICIVSEGAGLEHTLFFHVLGNVGNHNPKCRTHIFQRGRYTTCQKVGISAKKHISRNDDQIWTWVSSESFLVPRNSGRAFESWLMMVAKLLWKCIIIYLHTCVQYIPIEYT